MGRIVVFVMGPAGSGKSSFSEALEKHLQESRRSALLVNLDPAAEELLYEPAIDVRNLISINETTKFKLGPNGGLVFCMEYLANHIHWLKDWMDSVGPSDDEYFIVDCPGQIELYTHVSALRDIIRSLRMAGYLTCGMFLVDTTMAVGDPSQFLSAVLLATSSMVSLEMPWLNVLSKVDLVPKDSSELDHYCNVDFGWLRQRVCVAPAYSPEHQAGPLTQRMNKLNLAVCSLMEDFSMVRFCPLASSDPESLDLVLHNLDMITQYGEDLEPREDRNEHDDDDDE